MTILDRYLATRTLSVLVKSIVALVFLFILVDLLTHRRGAIMRHDIPWDVVARYYLYLTPAILQEHQVAALGMLLSTILVLGTAAQHNEVTAMMAGGIGLRRIVLAPVVIAALLAVGIFAFGETVGTVADARAREIEARYFARNQESERPGVTWARLPGNWKCHIAKFNREALTGENILMLRRQEDTSEQIQAKRIFWDETASVWVLEGGRWSTFYHLDGEAREAVRITQRTAPIPETPEMLFAFAENASSKRVGELAETIAIAKDRGMPTARLEVDYHMRFARPALPFIMVLLAIPFAIRLRQGGFAVGLGMCVAAGLAYLVALSVAQGLGYTGRIPAVAAAWLANGLFLLVAGVLFVRTPS